MAMTSTSGIFRMNDEQDVTRVNIIEKTIMVFPDYTNQTILIRTIESMLKLHIEDL
jgi:hypothetical protein